ncbi:hypothetical protein FRC03_000734 [Tulasnella sp. 419]|nr:hypothetical protein FRC03_000734 [Tulasnella sp. 419]
MDSISSNLTTSTSATSISCEDEDDSVQLPGFLPAPKVPVKTPISVIDHPAILNSKSDCNPIDYVSRTLSAEEHQKRLVVEKDTIIFVSPPAVHYNPKYYPDPYEFKPERFLGDFDPKTFLPFSSGTRICLGRHFSEVESVCWIAYMMRHFSVHPVPAFEGETMEQMKERMFNAVPLITLSPLSIPLTFRRRPPPS